MLFKIKNIANIGSVVFSAVLIAFQVADLVSNGKNSMVKVDAAATTEN